MYQQLTHSILQQITVQNCTVPPYGSEGVNTFHNKVRVITRFSGFCNNSIPEILHNSAATSDHFRVDMKKMCDCPVNHPL